MAQFTGSLVNYPARASFASFFVLVALGAMVLMHPACGAAGKAPISALDALFTATSASCVTGLTVRSTGFDFSLLGQGVIVLLIQTGGVGIITLTTFITFQLGARESLRHRAVAMETLGAAAETDLRWLLGNVLLMTLLIEGMGAVLLTWRFSYDMPWPQAAWAGVFHAVSAFCNAGFSLWDENIIRYQGDLLVNLTIMSLIVLGGLGFPVLVDIRRNWRGPGRRLWDRLHLHSKIMLLGTVFLLSLGTAAFLTLEWSNTLKDLPWDRKLLVAMFQSVVPRTAGFNSVDIGQLTNATLFLIIVLMLIGAGPCSTAGGLKVSTMMVLAARAWATFRGFLRVNLFRRTIPPETMARATTTALVFIIVASVAFTGMLVQEQAALPHQQAGPIFVQAAFEVVSALGTVGLSTGITPKLSGFSQLILIATMFIGRLGPIAVFAALSRGSKAVNLEHPQEEPLIG